MSDNIIYKEGLNIEFKIVKHLELSESETFYVLQDCNGRMQLLDSSYYKAYNFNIGQFINCRVDHINCSGKIFLEPEHPFYKEGDNYEFKIKRIDQIKNKFDEYNLHISFFDKLGNPATCIIEHEHKDMFAIGQNLKCKVERIKKGYLYLSPEGHGSKQKFNKGNYYSFTLDDIRILSDNIKYYILSDKKNAGYLLKHEYYKNHNFKIGQVIECNIIKYSSKGYYILEPRHPLYKPEESYDFEFVNCKKDLNSTITGNYDITVKDVFGNDVKFISDKSLMIDGTLPKKITCKVIGIKKGKPVLAL